MSGRLVTFWDDEYGSISAAVDSDGAIIATASSYIADGVYVAVDEAGLYEASGELMPLLPPELWDRAVDNDESPA